MADPGLERLLGELEATFDAAIDREEEQAAGDLAFSLRQDRALPDALARSGPLALREPGGGVRPILALGQDYVLCGGRLISVVPLARAVVEHDGEGPSPRRHDGDLLGLLRSWARRGARAEVHTDAGEFSGTLASVSPDHVTLQRRGSGAVTCAVGALRGVSLVGANSEDVVW